MEKAVIIGKRIECVIGMILLVPAFLGIIAFVLCLFDCSNDFSTMDNLSQTWSDSLQSFENREIYSGKVTHFAAVEAMSSAQIYLGLMAIAGVWLIKDSFKYFFMKSK